MSALTSLVRVHSWALAEKRRKLAGLETLAQRLADDLARLEAELRSEQAAASGSIEGTVAFPTFVAAALERRKRLRESIADVERAIEAARAEVTEAFQEVKKFELAQAAQEARDAEERARREQAILDELGLTLKRRTSQAAEE